jgi:hypothetical protein
MQYIKLKISAVLLSGFGMTGLYAQEAISSGGGNASGSGGSASYSVGQVVSSYQTGTNGSLSQGVQQPYEIWIMNGLDDFAGISIDYRAYPNPSKDFILLKVDNDNIPLSSLTLFMYDMNGKLIMSLKINDIETIIHMENLKPAIYYLKVIQDSKEVKTFKIIKN